MAQTADQWYAKLKKFVPSWYFEGDEQAVCYTRGVFKGLAAVMAAVQSDADDQQAVTFIMNAADVAPYTDLHGSERSVIRQPGELDAAYKIRIRDGLFVQVGSIQLIPAVNAALNNGAGEFVENYQYGFFDDAADSGFFYDTTSRYLESQKWYNWWTVFIPIQTGGVQADIMAAIVTAIELNRAMGTTYDILYGSASDTDTGD